MSAFTLIAAYIIRNIDALCNLQPRQSKQSLYSPSFDRAATIVTAANAGLWTALPIRPKFVRDIAGLVFGVFYLLAPAQAEEKSRKFHENTSVHHIRAGFELTTNPYIDFFGKLLRPRLQSKITFQIPRPKSSIYARPVAASLWYDKPIEDLQNETKIIFHIHGGGFLSTTPELHADSLTAWAKQTKVPIIAIDYRVAPEYPFPYALDECFEAYLSIMESLGLCVGLSGTIEPDVVITGDSAGGNIAAATMLKIILHNKAKQEQALYQLKKPVAIVLTYPALDLGPAGLHGKQEMDLIKQQAIDDGTNNVLEKKEKIIETYYAGLTTVPMRVLVKAGTEVEEHEDRHPLSLPSRALFAGDRILASPALYALVLMYLGTDPGHTDFRNEPLVSPLWADLELLAEFPKCYVICGDTDPLVDDSVMFMSRLRAAKKTKPANRSLTPDGIHSRTPSTISLSSDKTVNSDLLSNHDIAEIKLLPSVSHGFIQLLPLYPETAEIYKVMGNWFMDSFKKAPRHVITGPIEVDTKLYKNPFRQPRKSYR